MAASHACRLARALRIPFVSLTRAIPSSDIPRPALRLLESTLRGPQVQDGVLFQQTRWAFEQGRVLGISMSGRPGRGGEGATHGECGVVQGLHSGLRQQLNMLLGGELRSSPVSTVLAPEVYKGRGLHSHEHTRTLGLPHSKERRTNFHSRRYQHSGRQEYRFRQYQGWESGPSPSRASLLVRPLLFTVVVVAGSFAAAAIYYSETRVKEGWLVRVGLQPSHRHVHQVHDYWGWRLSTGQVVAAGLVGANVVVYLAWMFGRGRGRMAAVVSQFLQRNFLLYPFSGRAFPLLGSAFSHIEFLHLAFNMFALWSFAPLLVSLLGPETFMAAYLSSAVVTSLGGMLIHLGLTVTLPSCGASGAILFLFSTSALLLPSASYRILFLPFISFTGPQLLAGVVALDLAGLVLGWKMFNHGAHLTGALLGVLFVNGGGGVIHKYQVWCIKTWRKYVKNKK